MLKTTLPPGPKGTLVGGNLRDFSTQRLDFFMNVARDYGDLASFRFGPRRVFLASHPDLIEQVLVTDAKHYIKHFGARGCINPCWVTGWSPARAISGCGSGSSRSRRSSRTASTPTPR